MRTFDFDRTVSLGVALDIIRAALDDEGLVLHQPDNCTANAITSVLIDGRKLVIVPAGRIGWKVA